MLFSTLLFVVNGEFMIPSLSWKFTKDSQGKAFVNVSAIISLLETYSSLIFCCAIWSDISMCLACEWDTRLLDKAMLLVLLE